MKGYDKDFLGGNISIPLPTFNRSLAQSVLRIPGILRKGIYSDNRFVMLTGHNLNPRAWRLDIENGLLIDDPQQELHALLEQELSEILQHTLKITEPEQIEGVNDYPEHVKKLLLRMRRIKADKLVKGLI